MEDKLVLVLYKIHTPEEEIVSLTESLMNLMSDSFLPAPEIIDQADRKKKSITGYRDSYILDITREELSSRQLVFSLLRSDYNFSVTISPSVAKYSFLIELPLGELPSVDHEKYRMLFRSICNLTKPDVCRCFGRSALSRFREKYFEWEGRTPNFGFFTWLQYFGPNEFQKQGGDLIFQNPFIKAERMGDGVLIEVGSGPLDVYTPEGEELLLKATRALPPVVKD